MASLKSEAKGKRSKASKSHTMLYSLPLPDGTDTAWFDSASPEEAAAALKLGAALYTHAASLKAGEAVAALEAKQALELAAVRAAAEERITAVQKELEAATADRTAAQQRAATLLETQRTEWTAASTAEKDRLATSHAARLAESQKELAAQQERFKALEERLSTLRAGRDDDVRHAEERTRVLLQVALDGKTAAIQVMKEAHERQAEELRALGDLLRKKVAANSRTKGTDYENEFRDRLIQAFGVGENFRLVDSARSGIGHAGDYLMNWGDHTLLWEVKNYDHPVPTKEVEKFRRDMKENAQVRVGVMISRQSPITGMMTSGDRAVEFLDGKLYIYLSNFESMSDDTLPNLLHLFRVWWKADHGVAEEEDDAKIAAVRSVERLHGEATRAKTEWRLHKSRMDDALRWMSERVEETEARLRSTLNALQGAVSSAEVPEGVFRDATGNEKLLLDIQTIVRHTEVTIDAKCKLNDLARVFAKERGMSESTAASHIAAVLADSSLERAVGKPTWVRGLRLRDSLVHVS
jgi:hypothetical protein